ncbi:MAG: hypothetical protein WDM81_20745 [Rhizomicrobium sp.]
MMLIGNLALTGVGIPNVHVGFAGFYSKDSIIDAAYLSQHGMAAYAFLLTLVAAGMTSFYSWRQFLMTFHGRYRGQDHVQLSDSDDHSHTDDADDDSHHAPALSEVHEPPYVMLVPLGVLALGAVFAGIAFDHFFIGHDSAGFWHGALAAIARRRPEAPGRGIPRMGRTRALVLTVLGFGVAYYYYILNPDLPRRMAAKRGLLYLFLYNKWYFDELLRLPVRAAGDETRPLPVEARRRHGDRRSGVPTASRPACWMPRAAR